MNTKPLVLALTLIVLSVSGAPPGSGRGDRGRQCLAMAAAGGDEPL